MTRGWSVQRGPGALTDLLHRPVVTVGITEEQELPAISGVQGLDPPDLDAPPGQLARGRLDVVDDQLQPGPQRPEVSVRTHQRWPDNDRARRPRRGQLHNPQGWRGLSVNVEAESQLVDVEALRPVDVGDRDHHNFQLPVHDARPFRGGALVELPALGRSCGARLDILHETDAGRRAAS